MTARPRLLGALLGLLPLVVIAGARGPRGPVSPPRPFQALTDDDRKDFYHMAEGSELFPAQWLAALVSAKTGKPFLEDLGRFGAIDDPKGPEVKSGTATYRLPVGVTLAKSRPDGLPMMGVNCAACHVGELTYGDKKARIDGGPALFDIEGFYQEAFASFGATLRDRELSLAFLERLSKGAKGDKVAALAGKLRASLLAEGGKDGLGAAIIGRLEELVAGGAAAAKATPNDYYRLLAPGQKKGNDDKAIDLLQTLGDRLEGRAAGRSKVRDLFDPKRATLEKEVVESLRALGPEGLARLEARVVFLRRLRAQHAPGQPQFPPGHGRVDAFVTARNLLFSEKDALPANSPVRFPSIWDLAERKWLHWDANTNSVLERNIGQALGLGALATPDGHSTVLPRNLHRLEEVVGKLKAPGWPSDFPAIDKAKAADGKKVYAKYCAGCHDKGEGEHKGEGGEFAGFRVYTLAQLKTDPQRALNFATPLSDGTEFVKALAAKLRAIKKQSYIDHKVTPAEQKTYDLPDDKIRWVTTKGYVARPLRGIWAAAPYLHNGSVPTLDDLLRPEDERPVVFPVGPTEYDPVRVGVVSSFRDVPKAQRGRMGVYDTRLKGNSNRGHSGAAFGTELPEGDRKALLEYLKGLGG
jgi:mono/diheme cytochrome c family protein